MGLITVLKDVTLKNGTKLQREPTINEGTRALFDFRSKWSGVADTLPASSFVKSLTYNAATMKSDGVIRTIGGALYFYAVGQTLNISDDAIPTFKDTNWLLQFWFNPEKYIQAGTFNNQIINISSNPVWSYPSAMCAINLQMSADITVPERIDFAVRGKIISLSDITTIAKFTASATRKPMLVSIHYKYGVTTDLIEIYTDGTLLTSIETAPVKTEIALSFQKWLNASPAYPQGITGKFYRYRLDDLTQTDRTAAELIALEYTQCKDVFA